MSLETQLNAPRWILDPASHSLESFRRSGGGKASNLAALVTRGFRVPPFFCVPSDAFDQYRRAHGLDEALLRLKAETPDLQNFEKAVEELFLSHALPSELERELDASLRSRGWNDQWVAVRSSGLEEDGTDHSFAGQFSSFLFQKGMEAVDRSLRRCWASAYSARALSYRVEKGLPVAGLRMGVVIQRMVNCEAAGVAFSRNPIRPLDTENAVVSSVWGLGEGLVSGELDADHFEVSRKTGEIRERRIVEKPQALVQSESGGLKHLAISGGREKQSSLTDGQVGEVSGLCLELEEKLGMPQDCEWGFENGTLFCLQTRPITTLPPAAFYSKDINGAAATLWDNSNIIESYNGVTSPLTFSFASSAYRQVYIQFCQVVGVPESVIRSHESMFRNMLGLMRGRIYYNLANWYRLVLMLPGASNNKAFMETMMGVKQQLKPEVAAIFDFAGTPMRYSLPQRLKLLAGTIHRWRTIDAIITDFKKHFDHHYHRARKMDFRKMPLTEHLALYQQLDEEILRRWHAPIINDYLCMVFFGLLKKLTEKWLPGPDSASLQNDLLCGEGDLESTEPTKMLMRIADWIDNSPAASAVKAEILSGKTPEILERLLGKAGQPSAHPEAERRIREFLDRYGFRCINELKLEEKDLHDDPSFVIEAISAYVRRKAYSIAQMEERERAIRTKAEAQVRSRLGGVRLLIYNWVLGEARRAVKNRENLRFDRTKIFGVIRHLFRGMGHQLVQLGKIDAEADVFFLTTDELIAWIEGRSTIMDLRALVSIRKSEAADFEKQLPPPDRFYTQGAAGYSNQFPAVLLDADLLRNERPESDDPNVLIGTPCCPGVVEGVVRVVKQVADAQGLNGEILVTERTDPGWVPLYPSCSGLLIERGSLLSHSAVVARELGLPTIVGVSGGLVKKLKTGMKVRVDAGKGEIRILGTSEQEQPQ
jgi:pyruvate,water dikinase